MTYGYRNLLFTMAAVLFCPLMAANAADHLDAPNLQVAGTGDKDLNDLYAFQSPTNPDNSVLILTVNPFAGQVNPLGTQTSGTTFSDMVEYQFQIDNDGDQVADVTYATTFAAPVAGQQAFTTLRNGGAFAAGTTGANATATVGGTITAGLFDDPFFFDFGGFLNGLMFTGDDTFAGANVSAIVLEVPSSDLGGSSLGVWARTVDSGSQVDRIGRPAINTVLIPSARKTEFNEASPANDVSAFGGDVNAAIAGLSDQANADGLTPALLPDVLGFDPTSANGFADDDGTTITPTLNGRRLTDDVIDAELTLLTGSSTPVRDGVGANDVAFPNTFPYLAPANVIPEPSSMALLVLGIAALGGRRRALS